MKYLIILSLSAMFMLQSIDRSVFSESTSTSTSLLSSIANNNPTDITFQDTDGSGKMSATVFKHQKFCRAELKDFEFDARFDIVSATVYFSGANFRGVEKGFIASSSLQPVASLMERCIPGSIVVFDDVKVLGPDKEVRKIQGVTYLLY
jgi:hypothetical protein